MNKTKSIVTYVLVGLFIVLMAVLSFVEFPIGDYDYHGYANTIKLGLDLSGGVSAVFDVTDTDVSKSELEVRIQGAVNRLSSMLVSKGYTEAKVSYDMSGTYPQIRVEVPDVDDPESMFDLINRPASLQFVDSSDNTKVLLEGRDCIETAYVGYNQQLSGNQYYVGLKMNEKGTKIWEQVTSDLTANGTKTGTFTVLINGEVYMEKVQVSEVISTGSGMLTQGGNSGYTYDKANEMASSMQAGAFGVTLHLAESRVLGPVLGENAIKNGLIAGAIGLGIIIAFMCIYYRKMGIMASLALMVYIVLVVFLCSVLPWVQLTLEGIAGIILGIGMAVDANVVIFERSKDEYAQGKTLINALDIGFKRGRTAVIDANVTTIIGALVLYFVGGSSIQGFAITLLISIVVSMFTALVVTRFLIKAALPYDSMDGEGYGLKRGEVL